MTRVALRSRSIGLPSGGALAKDALDWQRINRRWVVTRADRTDQTETRGICVFNSLISLFAR
jgi:hypothetical protein